MSSQQPAYPCLPAGFSFRCYQPLDPRLPSATSEPVPLVRSALQSFPRFERDVVAGDKEAVATIGEAARVLAEGRAERRHVADLDRTIQEQTAVAEQQTARAVATLRSQSAAQGTAVRK